jgi:hypothetical protein
VGGSCRGKQKVIEAAEGGGGKCFGSYAVKSYLAEGLLLKAVYMYADAYCAYVWTAIFQNITEYFSLIRHFTKCY